jgi:hypothetical protein
MPRHNGLFTLHRETQSERFDMDHFLILLGYAILAQPPVSDSLTPEQIASANASAISGIRSLAVQVKMYNEISGEPKKRIGAFTWNWAGPEQRVTLRLPGSAGPEDIIDRYNGANGFKETRNCDPESPPILSEMDGGRCYGTYGPQDLDRGVFSIYPKQMLLMEVN